MEEYKIESYTVQKLDNETLLPTGNKQTRFAVYKKTYPFPNKAIHVWERVKSFGSKKQAGSFLKEKQGQRTRLAKTCSTGKKYIDIQNEVISKYKIDICDGTKCKDDWGRTHAHLRPRRVCKWKQANSLQSTFTLFHEIGHIMTNKSTMRRAEEEYYATVWAIEEMKKYNLTVPQKTLQEYQEYIDMEIDRGIRRGGTGYGSLKIV
jgi:hypothetical protein